MRPRLLSRFCVPVLPLVLPFLSIPPSSRLPADEKGPEIRWRKHDINDRSPFEAAGAADFDGDGRTDILSGDTLYLGPAWKPHKVRTVPASGPNPHYYEDFADLPLDVNGDGKPDIVTCTFFSRKIAWAENTGNPSEPWIEHAIDDPG